MTAATVDGTLGAGEAWPAGAGPEPAFWSPPERRLLLRSAFLPAEAARAAWREWRAAHPDFGNIDYASFCLLPLVHARLREIGERDPQELLLPGLYRRIWFHNHVLQRGLFAALDALGRAGIDFVLLKGVAAPLGGVLYYGDPEQQPIDATIYIVAKT